MTKPILHQRKPNLETISESIYDHPRYYDLVYGSDTAAELNFLDKINEKFLKGKSRQLFEPACGTGRLLYKLSKRNFQVEGIDLNEKAVEFSNQRFKRHGLEPTAWVADMSDFKSKKKFDLAFNTINSFRHLTSEKAALDHLNCMSDCSKRGGMYLIGFNLTPTTADGLDRESWSARRGHLAVMTQMWTIEHDTKKRVERFGIWFDVYTPTKMFRIKDELKMRSYTPNQFSKLVGKSDWEIVETYDFAYNIEKPIVVDSATEDVIYALRKK